jgi:hypothetical protein
MYVFDAEPGMNIIGDTPQRNVGDVVAWVVTKNEMLNLSYDVNPIID